MPGFPFANADVAGHPDEGRMTVSTLGRVWAVTHELALSLRYGRAAYMVPPAQAAEIKAGFMQGRGPVRQQGNNVAIISLSGVITPHFDLMEAIFGGGSGGLDMFLDDLSVAVADPDVSHIVLNVDSPGGQVDGVPEAAAAIRAARESKPIVSVANTMMASAAYWLASQANEVVVTPSGSVGSVGVYKMHQDVSGAAEQAGIVPTLISAGEHKVDGHPFGPMSTDAAAKMQQDVNDYYGMFVNDVARGRGVDVPSLEDGMAFGAGQVMIGKRAVSTGLADKVATLGETVSRLASGRARVKQQAQASVITTAVLATGEEVVPATEISAGDEETPTDGTQVDDTDVVDETVEDETVVPEPVAATSPEDKRRIFDLHVALGGLGTNPSDREVANA